MEKVDSGWKRFSLRRSTTLQDEDFKEGILEDAPAPPNLTVIEYGCTLEGRLVVDRPIRVDGDLRGSIVSPESVFIAKSGSVVGDIRARSIEIEGAVVGQVIASREVVLHTGAKLHGDVETASFVVDRGGYFNGTTRMHLPQHASRSQAPRADGVAPG